MFQNNIYVFRLQMNTLEKKFRLIDLVGVVLIVNLLASFIRIVNNNNFLNFMSIIIQLDEYIPKMTDAF